MKTATVKIEGIPGSPYSQSALHATPFLDREQHQDYDVRTWLEHCTTNREGQVCIPAMALKQSIDTAAQKLGMKISGKRGATYKGYFLSGFIVDSDVPLYNGHAIKREDAECRPINANSDGVRGSGKRVIRRYPEFARWNGTAKFIILDDIIAAEVFEQHVRVAGMIVGIGRFRPEKGGTNGRFRAVSSQWEDITI